MWLLLAVLAGFVLAALLPTSGSRLGRTLRRRLRPLTRRPWLCCLVVGLVSLAVNATVGLAVHMAQPAVHDEFSYLLAGETFSQGRLTNPSPPMWRHFQSFHLVLQPTYQSKYPPAQGIALAVGFWLGHPLYGVWLSLAAASAACCWMYQGWMPPRWALLAGLVTALDFEVFLRWGQSYWGGAMGMLGGALLFGALPRILRGPKLIHSVCLSLGLFVLATSRMQEGFIAALCVAVVLAGWLATRHRPPLKDVLKTFLLPTAVLLIAGACWLGYYHWRVTGSPTQLPYDLSRSLFRQSGVGDRALAFGGRSDPISTLSKLHRLWWVYWRIPLSWPLVALPFVVRRPRGAFVFAVCLISVGISLATSRSHPHYLSPVACLLWMLPIQSLRYLRTWRGKSGHAGRFMASLFPMVFAAGLVTGLSGRDPLLPDPDSQWAQRRVDLAQELAAKGGRHVVIVRYDRSHNLHEEWVYNRADIDAATIVWARDLGPEWNAKLAEYYPDRSFWLFEPDARPPRLVPYDAAAGEQPADSGKKGEPADAPPAGSPFETLRRSSAVPANTDRRG